MHFDSTKVVLFLANLMDSGTFGGIRAKEQVKPLGGHAASSTVLGLELRGPGLELPTIAHPFCLPSTNEETIPAGNMLCQRGLQTGHHCG